MLKDNIQEHAPFLYSVCGSDDEKHIKIVGLNTAIDIENLVIPSHIDNVPVKILGEGAFENISLIHSVSIPDTVTEIHPFCFAGCSKLKDIAFPDSVRKIFPAIFAQCDELEHVKWSKYANFIHNATFRECKKLKKVSNIDLVEGIDSGAFCGSGLITFKLPSKCVYVESAAFAYCPNLKLVKINAKLVSMSSITFSDTPNITLDCSENDTMKDWAIRNNIPIYETQIRKFLNDIKIEDINKNTEK